MTDDFIVAIFDGDVARLETSDVVGIHGNAYLVSELLVAARVVLAAEVILKQLFYDGNFFFIFFRGHEKAPTRSLSAGLF